MMAKVTFGYIVGGADKHYNNMIRSVSSLERIEQDYNVLILDADGRLENDDPKVKIVHYPIDNQSSDGWFQPHYWQMRYHLYEHLDTDYCFYMDSDTVIVNDRVDELVEESEDKFMICRHWWVPTLGQYARNVRNSLELHPEIIGGATEDTPYIASGLFLFKNGDHNNVFEKFAQKFDQVFSSGKNADGITDEMLLSLSLHETQNYKFTNGSMNHSSNREQMPLIYTDNFYGKNPQDEEFKPVFAFHNDIEEFYGMQYFHGKSTSEDELFLKKLKEVCYMEEQ